MISFVLHCGIVPAHMHFVMFSDQHFEVFMCIVLFQWQPDSETPLVLAANRDEFYARPTEAARWRGTLFCGLDKQAGGTWIGVTRDGRFAAITNFRESLNPLPPQLLSRGNLPMAYLQGTQTPQQYARQVADRQAQYGPFNLLVGDKTQLWYVGNRGAAPQPVSAGLHGLSNALLDTPWPKVERGKQLLKNAIQQGASQEALLNVLTDKHQPADHELPKTGVPEWMEKMVAPIFIESAQYGTRCSTLLTLTQTGEPQISEHLWPRP